MNITLLDHSPTIKQAFTYGTYKLVSNQLRGGGRTTTAAGVEKKMERIDTTRISVRGVKERVKHGRKKNIIKKVGEKKMRDLEIMQIERVSMPNNEGRKRTAARVLNVINACH